MENKFLGKLYEITLWKYNQCRDSTKRCTDEALMEELVWQKQAYRMIFDICNELHRKRKAIDLRYIFHVFDATISKIEEWSFDFTKSGFRDANPYVIMADTVESVYDDFMLCITERFNKEDVLFYEF